MHFNFKGAAIALFAVCISLAKTHGQSITTDTTDIFNLPLDELMKNNSKAIPSLMDTKMASSVEVATAKPMALRKSPAILSVISAEDIVRSGARDLMDILNTVPGFDFAVDVEGVVGIGVRGNWANEGKVLLLLDGQEMNETVYGTIQFGNSFPLENIKRIEVIRGPGSAIYGGAAEYAVINIISKTETDWKGMSFEASHGRFRNSASRSSVSVSAADKIKNVGFSVNGFLSDGKRSDRMYADIFGNEYDMSDNSGLKNMNLNVGLTYRNLTVRALYFNSVFQIRDGFDKALQNSYNEHFKTCAVEAKYAYKITEKMTLLPRISFKRNSPWEVNTREGQDADEADEVVYKTVADRYKVNLTTVWDASKDLNITGGVEGFYDYAEKAAGDVFRNSNKTSINYFNAAFFYQSVYKNKIANIIIGARYDYNNSFGDAFIPRLGLTKRVDRFNFKLLYSQSFKAPAIENVETSLQNNIMPEKTFIWEFETGCQLTKNMFIAVNLFDITTKNTIIYYVDTAANVQGVPDGYFNADRSGSHGVEVEYKLAGYWGNLNIGYSYYDNGRKGKVATYEDPLHSDQALAFGKSKLSLAASFNLASDFYVSPSFIYKSSKSGIVKSTGDGDYIFSSLPSTCVTSLYIGKNNLFFHGLRASAGVYNVFNEKIDFVQPYASGHAPLPGASREILIKLGYSF